MKLAFLLLVSSQLKKKFEKITMQLCITWEEELYMNVV
jgi:hypothetical protein